MRFPSLLGLTFVAACSASTPRPAPAPTPAAPKDDSVTHLADEILHEWIEAHPTEAVLNGMEGAPDGGFADNSTAALAAWQAREDAWSARLARIDGDALWGRPEWLTYGFVRDFLDGARANRVCRMELWPVNQMSGWPAWLAELAQAQRVGTAELRAKALSRFRAVPRYIDHEMANAREGLRLGYSTPRENVDLVIKQLDDILKLPVEKSPFFSPAERDRELAAPWTALLRDEIQPAIQRELDFLKNEYRPRAREALGVAANRDGAACYRASFRVYTTIERDPDETYRLGEQTVQRNVSEAQALAQKVLGVTDLHAIVSRLNADPRNRFRSREEDLEFARTTVERAKAGLSKAFATIPAAPVGVEPVAPFLEAAASDSYQPASADGSRAGVYHINLGAYAATLRSNAEITAFHEAYPGHHYQIALARETPGHHKIEALVANSAFGEGWARYAEALSEEMGLYGSDLAKIQRRLWPARGMVADPGLHLRGWTRQKTVAYLVEAGRFTPAQVDALVNRMAAWPAQLTAYDTGGLEIFALRRKAETALGLRFDLKKFHVALLENGAVTLPMLRKIIDHWIESQR
ncbi:DUF885 domain-containing protein [Pendulispora rubella]|uniref:DUF885 domain-containing protein n=1 Tax=Pendulispora rubella TaxID=2741070 RepID=A0ABZ2KV21_9BACT